ncbi:MAG: alpha/beta hydrolase [Clostridiales bacterium]|nr:alpha/beta hydrolase [Clostridiales bacterium]
MKAVVSGPPDGPVVMLVHGGGLSWWNFRDEAALLDKRFRVALPILDGHAGSGAAFTSIEGCARRLLELIDETYGGSVLLLGGVSLGAQVVAEALSMREDICRYAIIESALAIPSRLTQALVDPAVASSHGLMRRLWFARLQARALNIKPALFEEYYRDTCAISKNDLAAFLKANASYAPSAGLKNSRADVRIVVGAREPERVLRSARLIDALLPNGRVEVKPGLRHGEYALGRPDEYVKELLAQVDGHAPSGRKEVTP